MKKFSFFQHRDCEYFPCHTGVAEEEFNCLFCYCPLYCLGENCGGDFVYLEDGTKSCLNCAFPHELVPTTGSIPGIKAFIAAVIGGIGSIPGALIGGLLLGFVEQFSRSILPVTELTDAVVYSVLIIVLLFRPTGLLGKKIREKV